MLNEMREWIEERMEDGTTTWDGCDAAIVGVVERCSQPPLVCYDYARLVQCFVDEEMDEEGARDWVDYNIVGAWVGDGTPVILYRPETAS